MLVREYNDKKYKIIEISELDRYKLNLLINWYKIDNGKREEIVKRMLRILGVEKDGYCRVVVNRLICVKCIGREPPMSWCELDWINNEDSYSISFYKKDSKDRLEFERINEEKKKLFKRIDIGKVNVGKLNEIREKRLKLDKEYFDGYNERMFKELGDVNGEYRMLYKRKEFSEKDYEDCVKWYKFNEEEMLKEEFIKYKMCLAELTADLLKACGVQDTAYADYFGPYTPFSERLIKDSDKIIEVSDDSKFFYMVYEKERDYTSGMFCDAASYVHRGMFGGDLYLKKNK